MVGYTHYWDLKGVTPQAYKEGFKRAEPTLVDIIDKYAGILDVRRGCGTPGLRRGVMFNGVSPSDCEDFVFLRGFPPESFNFCKTNRKLYDGAVCECLLVLAAHIEGMKISSDGLFANRVGVDSTEEEIKAHLDDQTWARVIDEVENRYWVKTELKVTEDPGWGGRAMPAVVVCRPYLVREEAVCQ
jgi:hypothetical protein